MFKVNTDILLLILITQQTVSVQKYAFHPLFKNKFIHFKWIYDVPWLSIVKSTFWFDTDEQAHRNSHHMNAHMRTIWVYDRGWEWYLKESNVVQVGKFGYIASSQDWISKWSQVRIGIGNNPVSLS